MGYQLIDRLLVERWRMNQIDLALTLKIGLERRQPCPVKVMRLKSLRQGKIAT
jgi:hypothetical protein